MASPTSWSVLVLVKLQTRSAQAKAKFAVGTVFVGKPPGSDPELPPPPPQPAMAKTRKSHAARDLLLMLLTRLLQGALTKGRGDGKG